MTSAAIMQPTYLPWAGYFYLIGSVDDFVLLDDVQLERQSWQTRNRILGANGEIMLSLPVERSGAKELIRDCRLKNAARAIEKHCTTIRQSYGRSPEVEFVISTIENKFSAHPSALSEFTGSIIRSVADALQIRTKFHVSSELDCAGQRSKKLENICQKLNARLYISPPGARDYLEHDRFGEDCGIERRYSGFVAHPYRQRWGAGFVSHLSIVDVICCLGFDGARKYVRGDPA